MQRTRNEIVDSIKQTIGATTNEPQNETLKTESRSGVAPQSAALLSLKEETPSISLKDIRKESRKALKLINANPSFPLVVNKKVANNADDLQRIYGELLVQEKDLKTKERLEKRNAKKSEMKKKKQEFLEKYKEESDIKKPKDEQFTAQIKPLCDYPEDEYHISDGIVRKVGGVCGVIDGDNVIEVPKISKHDIDVFLDNHKDYILERIAQQTERLKQKTKPEIQQREIVRDYLKEKESEEPILRKGTNAFSGDFSNRVLNQWFSKHPVRDAQQVVQAETNQQKIIETPKSALHIGLNPALFGRPVRQ